MPRKTPSATDTRALRATRFNEAAARCRGKPTQVLESGGGVGASMRPRPDAAENASCSGSSRRFSSGFNEAAARCRGKRYTLVDGDGAAVQLQ